MARIPLIEGGRGPLAKAAFAYSKRKYGKVVAPLKAYAHHGGVLFGTGQMEVALMKANSVPDRYKVLGDLRIAMRVGCPF